MCFQEFPYSKVKEFLQKIKPNVFDYSFAIGFSNKKGAYGQLTAFNKKVKLLDKKIIKLPYSSFIEEKVFKNKGSRSALFTTLQLNNKKITIINIHLLSLVLNKTRKNQIVKILNVVNKFYKEDSILLLGDFNYTSLIRQNKFLDFMSHYFFKNAYTLPTYQLILVKHQVDYVFYKNCRVQNVEVTKIHFSDHFPIRFTIEF